MARHGAMLGASRERGVTASAVSHPLRDLTRSVGEDLFGRTGRSITLTEAGVALAAKLDGVFDVLKLVGNVQARLRIAACSAFGPGWMAPRLRAFRAAHPQIDVELRLYAQNPEQTQDWQIYAGLDLEAAARGGWVRCNDYVLALSHARAGLGVALVPDFLAKEHLAKEHRAEGKLRRRHPLAPPSWRIYRLCIKKARSAEDPIRRLTGWLRHETVGLRTPG